VAGQAFRHVLVIECKRLPIIKGMAINALTLEVQRINIGVIEVIRIGQIGIDHIIIGVIRHC